MEPSTLPKKMDPFTPSPISVDQNQELPNINTKFYPQKKNVCRGESSSSINQYLKPLSNSPIVDYYTGLGNKKAQKPYNFFSPENNIPNEAFNKFNSKTMPIHKDEVPFYQMNNKMLFDYMNQGEMNNFNMSPGRLFNNNAMFANNLSGMSKSGNGSFGLINDNQPTFISKTLQKRFDGTGIAGISMSSSVSNKIDEEINNEEIQKNIKESDIAIPSDIIPKEEIEKNEEGDQEFYMLSFESDNKENSKDDELEEGEEKEDEKNKLIINDKGFDLFTKDNNGFIPQSYQKINQPINNQTVNKYQKPFPYNQSSEITKNNIQLNPQKEDTIKSPNPVNTKVDGEPVKKKKKKKNKKKKKPVTENGAINSVPSNQPIPKNDTPQAQSSQNPSEGPAKPKKKSKKKIKKIDPALYINLTIPELCQNILNLAKDQAGCRHIQTKIDEDPVNSIPIIFKSALQYFVEISMDTFGNYLIQKLFSQLKEGDFYSIITIIAPHILELGANPHGTRVIQHLINFLKTDKLVDYFISIIKPVTVPLIKELNGTHIIQKISEDFPEKGQFIYELILKNAPSIATHRHGCCVLQRYIINKEDEFCKKLVEKLMNNFFLLAVDQFGNYIVQSIMKLNDQNINNSIAMKMIDNILYYSKHKFSSNIVEKCFDYCDASITAKMVVIISEEEAIKELIIDEHGNYVVQKVLACSTPQNRNELFKYIVPMFGKLRTMNFGEKIISRLLLVYPEIGNMIESNNATVNTNNQNMINSLSKPPIDKTEQKQNGYKVPVMNYHQNNTQTNSTMNVMPTIINNNIIMINQNQQSNKVNNTNINNKNENTFQKYNYNNYGYNNPYKKPYSQKNKKYK